MFSILIQTQLLALSNKSSLDTVSLFHIEIWEDDSGKYTFSLLCLLEVLEKKILYYIAIVNTITSIFEDVNLVNVGHRLGPRLFDTIINIKINSDEAVITQSFDS